MWPHSTSASIKDLYAGTGQGYAPYYGKST